MDCERCGALLDARPPARGSSRRKEATIIAGGVLLLLLLGGFSYMLLGGGNPAREHAKMAVCLSNTKQLATGLLMYSQDYNGALPPASLSLQGIHAYVRHSDIYRCPSAPQQPYGYAMNAQVGSYIVSNLPHPELTVMLFDADTPETGRYQTVRLRHSHGASVGFIDGHVRLLKIETLANQRACIWDLPGTPVRSSIRAFHDSP